MVDAYLTRNQTNFSCHFIAIAFIPVNLPVLFYEMLRIISIQSNHIITVIARSSGDGMILIISLLSSFLLILGL